MVFFFTCSDPRYTVYMGKDKFDNEELLKYGWPEDVWFHVDKYSSAHIYLRLPDGSVDLSNIKDKAAAKEKLKEALSSIPEEIVNEMCQLTKANSIEGCKLSQVDIVYTPFLNLKKEEHMDTGTVGFKEEAFRIIKKNVEKDKEIVKKLEKTREEKKIDLAQEKEQRDTQERARRRRFNEEQKRKAKEEEKQHQLEKEQKHYTALQSLEKTSNTGVSKTGTIEECKDLEDDFM